MLFVLVYYGGNGFNACNVDFETLFLHIIYSIKSPQTPSLVSTLFGRKHCAELYKIIISCSPSLKVFAKIL